MRSTPNATRHSLRGSLLYNHPVSSTATANYHCLGADWSVCIRVCLCAGEGMRDRDCQHEHASVHAGTEQGKARWGETQNSAKYKSPLLSKQIVLLGFVSRLHRSHPVCDDGRGQDSLRQSWLPVKVMQKTPPEYKSGQSLQESMWLVEHSRQQEMRLASLWCAKTSSNVNLLLLHRYIRPVLALKVICS